MRSCPEHYENKEFQTIDFVDMVLDNVCDKVNLMPSQVYSIKDALKYAMRAGKKGPWQEDAYKCADYMARAITGKFLSEQIQEEKYNAREY